MTDHAERLREMAAGLPLRGRTRSIPEHWASMLAGAEALERYEEAKGVLRQIASGQSWSPQRDAEEALAKMESQ